MGVLNLAAWPATLLLFMSLWRYSKQTLQLDEESSMSVAYLPTIAVVLILERVIPHQRAWNSKELDRKIDSWPIVNDVAHSLVTAVSIGTSRKLVDWIFQRCQYAAPFAAQLAGYPWWCQFSLAMVTAEFGLYWHHRWSHTVECLWPFHALHHAVLRMWSVNTGRFHFVNQVQTRISKAHPAASTVPQTTLSVLSRYERPATTRHHRSWLPSLRSRRSTSPASPPRPCTTLPARTP